MSDTEAMCSLLARLRGHSEIMERDKGKFVRFIDVATCTEAADEIDALRAENARLREALGGPASWLDRWANHVGSCKGGQCCTCGLERARFDLAAAQMPDGD